MERYVIVGAGPAGLSAAAAIRQVDQAGEIVVVSEEPDPPYSRVLLSHWLEGQVGADGLRWWGSGLAEGLDLRLGRRVAALDPGVLALTLDSGERLTYSKLLLAAGSEPEKLRVPGAELPGIHTLRTLADARAIRAEAADAETALVVGGGLVALKAACALKRLGLAVTVVVGSGRLLSRNLDSAAAELVRRHLAERGLEFRFGAQVESFEGGRRGDGASLSAQGGRVRVAVVNGVAVPCGLVVVGKGVRPNTAVARQAGLAVGRSIVVDDRLETSHPGIFAAGDVAELRADVGAEAPVNAIWPNAVAQGRVAGSNMAGLDRRFRGLPRFNSVVLGGLPVVSAGVLPEERVGRSKGGVGGEQAGGYQSFILRSPGERHYRRAVLREGRLVGFCLVGDVAAAGLLLGLLQSGAELEGQGWSLLDGGLTYPRVRGWVGSSRVVSLDDGR